ADMPNSGPWRDLCLAHGILAYHCEPVVASDGSLLAALVLGFGETRLPTARELAAAAFGARIAAIAIQRDRSQGVIRRSEGRFRAFVAASTNSIYRMSADWSEMRQLDGQGLLSATSDPRTDWLDAYIHREDQPRVMRAVRNAIEHKALFELEHRVRRADGSLGWAHSRAVPILGRDGEILEWFGAASDITETRRAAGQLRDSEERQRFLLDVGDRTRTLVDPEAVIATTTRMLGEKLGASRVVYANIDDASGYASIRGGWTDGGVAHLPEKVRVADFGLRLLACLRAGETLCAKDVVAHPATTDSAGVLESISVRALVSVPLLKNERLVANLNVHQDRPRAWTDAEVQLIEAVAERTWDALERAHAEAGRNRAAALSEAQNRVLERAVRDAPLEQTLEAIVAAVEGLSCSGVLASILVLDGDGRHLRRGAAPSLPAAYNQAVDGVAVGPDTGSCGRAVHTRAPVFVSDIATHPLWADFRDLALAHGLRACWSIPILSSAGAVLGTFAMYFAEPREPNPADLELVDFVIPSAALVIERKQSEERLRRSEARYRQIVEGAEEFAIVTLDADGIITSWNTGAERIVGYAAAETIGRPGSMLYVPEDQAARVPERELARARREGRSPNERWHVRKDGSLFWGSGLAMALDDGGYLKIFRDRTIEHEADAALRESEARLRESEEHYRHAAELNPQVAWTATPDGQLDRVAARWHEWTGSSGLGDTWGQGLHPADLGPTTEAWIRSVATGVPYDVEHRVRLRSGDYSWAHTRAYPRRGADGEIVKWYGSTENIHERRMAENALRASEQRYRRLIETIDDGFCVIEMIFEDGRAVDYRHIEMNPSFVRQSGFAAKPGHTVREVVPDFEAHWFEAFGRVAMTGRPERIEERSDATDRWYDVRATRVGDPGAHRVALLLTDVSNRRRAEQRLRGLNETLEARVAERTAALRLYRDIVQSDESPVCAFDTDYRIIAFNRAHEHEFFRIFGHHPTLWEVLPDAVPPDQASILRGFMDRALAGEAFTIIGQFGDPDRAKPHYEVNYMPLRDESGDIVGAFHHARNISARLRAEAELVQAQEALRQSQ
ncbi:MAG TPA: PAS domain S-box protein, partial [Pseudoxanthomonas sp.]|nr:PAS domain S-box protein [Pseudoxanthomonas sp.]